MSTLQRMPSRVQPDWREIAASWSPPGADADECEPFISPEDLFQPSRADEAWLVAFNAADAGEPADFPSDVPLGDRELVYMAHLRGDHAGRRCREIREAREIGYLMGCAGSASEPPSGFASHQQAPYREGYAAGATRRLVEDARFEAWVAMEEAEALEDHFSTELQDSDVHPFGCVS